MYSLITWIPWLIVFAVSFELSFRRSRILSRYSQWAAPDQRRAARGRAVWPGVCAAILSLPQLIVFHFVEDKLVQSTVAYLMVLTAFFFSGWLIGIIAGMDSH